MTALFDEQSIQSCVDVGVRRRPYRPGTRYTAFTDAASGTGRDSFTAAVAHGEKDRAVLDALLVIRPPFSPESAIRDVCTLLREYRVSEVRGDSYAPNYVSEAFARQRVGYRASDRDRSALYLDLLGRVNSGQVRLLDDADLLRELRGLERHRRASKDIVDHRRGSHDDAANSAAGALVLAAATLGCRVRFMDFDGYGWSAREEPLDVAGLPLEVATDPAWRAFVA